MAKNVFGWHQHKLQKPSFKIGLSDEQGTTHEVPAAIEPVEVELKPMIFAVSVPPKGGPPMVHKYANDEQGYRELANLIRGEHVLSIIIGHEIPFEHSSVVDLSGPLLNARLSTSLEKK